MPSHAKIGSVVSLVLRHFLYLDEQVVDAFLAQLRGGRVSGEDLRVSATRGRNARADAALGAPGGRIGASLGRSSGDTEESSYTLQETPESAFAHLYDALTNADAIQPLEALDDAIWDQLRKSEILEIESAVSVSTISRMSSLVSTVQPLLGAMETLGKPVDDEAVEAIRGFEALGSLFGSKVPVIARAAGSQKFKFLAMLEPEKLRCEVSDLDGEATLLAKVQRKLRPSERLTVLELIPGVSALPREERRKLGRDVKNTKDFPDAVLSAPAAVVTPIAIYR